MEYLISGAADAIDAAQDIGNGKPGMLFTGGKDAMVMLHIARERCDTVPPLLVIDTGVQFDAIYDFREEIAEEWGLELDVRRNYEAIEEIRDGKGYAWDGPKTDACCGRLKIDVMSDFIADGFDPLVVGRRSADIGHEIPVYDEDYREPVPHDRVHPLASWSDAHVAAYIKKHQIPLPSLYDEGYNHTDCVPCTTTGEEGDDWSGASQEAKAQLENLRGMGYM